MDLIQKSPWLWEIPATGGMRVPGRIYASDRLMELVRRDQAAEQVANVAHLPGIVEASLAMPDIHWGYGFPIGGVAATDIDAGGVVSPGGVGFDICCGVRLLRSALTRTDFAKRRNSIMRRLADSIPRGVGAGAIADDSLVERVLAEGARAAVDAGYGADRDLEYCEEGGRSEGGSVDEISELARLRGSRQLGSLGSGNHFLEVQVVERVVDAAAAASFGLAEGMVTVMIHCGSRGLGHQTCQDHLQTMGPAMRRHRIDVPDRQLACVPVQSEEGASYMRAMATSANFAWANRHVLADAARRAFAEALGRPVDALELDLVYDVAHNLAKIERHPVGGRSLSLCVHRKGATRAFAPGHMDLPDEYRTVGQPVLVPGSMGTASWVLRGVEGNPAFASAAHGAGRVMSRRAAKRHRPGAAVRDELEGAGIAVRPGAVGLLSEEAPYAYKDVDDVVEVCHRANLAAPVARLVPVGVVKG